MWLSHKSTIVLNAAKNIRFMGLKNILVSAAAKGADYFCVGGGEAHF